MIAGILSVAAPAYVVVGLAVALAFLLAGLDQVDPQARGAYWFRPLLIPGLVLLWPVVLVRWRSLAARRGELLQGRGVSFIPFGIVALLILMVMAATSHDFWLAFLGAPSWKRLHLLVYVAYFSATVHVLFGAIQDAQGWGLPGLALGSVVSLLGLHGLAARRGARALRTIAAPAIAPADPPPPWLDAGPPEAIPEDRAIILYPPDGEPVAIFRHAGTLSAVSNLCAHQNGPLGEGRIVDGCITCPWHGFQYRPDDGCSPPPFTEKIATYRLMLHDGRLWLDPRANPPGTKVPPLPFAPPQPPSAP